MKKIIILQNNGGRLANQLWNFASIYGYCLSRGYECENYSFFRYAEYFDFKISNKFVNFLFFKLLKVFGVKFTKALYFIYSTIVKLLNPALVVRAESEEFLLPPSVIVATTHATTIKKIDAAQGGHFYFCGWLFRNPVALTKYRQQIILAFSPREKYKNRVDDFLKNLRSEYKNIVGVHIRQGDYQSWLGGQYYFTSQEVRVILDDYLRNSKYFSAETCFVLCSDGAIDKTQFNGLNYRLGPGTEIEDLYALAGSNLIIGSNSTFGGWAAYYGNIPMITFSRNKINWPESINKV
ncbi:MAG: hypothetical protein A3J93_01035 [Candidatus Magasanikbacteria bacterium RIFOXYC2_FULL_42_28]|uniref:Glycosyl transferase family 11 n=1 Tax=Candidatus Magasanikbacteria bacterium RIFOXYC2_FULL_42_28 TaxID=1798704 RepID=A0A1F6NY66_9BACT|nr:MAG: hypothetical protein A3J93_01035 [Candidatus Magasanikbacteria bacterium RIFOXYC2_FULL_42_28]